MKTKSAREFKRKVDAARTLLGLTENDLKYPLGKRLVFEPFDTTSTLVSVRDGDSFQLLPEHAERVRDIQDGWDDDTRYRRSRCEDSLVSKKERENVTAKLRGGMSLKEAYRKYAHIPAGMIREWYHEISHSNK